MTATGDGAVVVGGASGIGAAVVAEYRRRGVAVAVWDRDGQRDVTCDLADPASVQQAVAGFTADGAVPRWLTVTAGIGHSASLLDAPVEAWDRVVGVNARGAWLVMRGVAQAMIDAGVHGSVVATSSISAHLADETMGLYGASKAALDAVVRVAALEWAAHGIRVNAVGPGVTQTRMLGPAPTDTGWLAGVQARTPLRRLGQPGDVAAAVLALHDLEWVTGQILDADGGLGLHSPIDPTGRARRPH